MTEMDLPILEEFLDATPTAELEPITSNYVQSDEADMGMTYAELSIFGRSRKEAKNGPYSTFTRLLHEWKDQYTPREIADKTKRFYHFYASEFMLWEYYGSVANVWKLIVIK
jgi:NAD+ synthase (glutamine-hydrolysing)